MVNFKDLNTWAFKIADKKSRGLHSRAGPRSSESMFDCPQELPSEASHGVSHEQLASHWRGLLNIINRTNRIL